MLTNYILRPEKRLFRRLRFAFLFLPGNIRKISFGKGQQADVQKFNFSKQTSARQNPQLQPLPFKTNDDAKRRIFSSQSLLFHFHKSINIELCGAPHNYNKVFFPKNLKYFDEKLSPFSFAEL